MFLTLLVGCSSSPVATGELGAWVGGPAMPTARANHCSTGVGEWVVVAGGNRADGGGFVTTDEVHAARLVDGVLGEWTLMGRTPSAVSECALASDGERLFLAGGIWADDAHRGQVWSAVFEDGLVFESLGSSMVSATSVEAAVQHGELLLTDTKVPMDGDMTRTRRMSMASRAWSDADWGFGFRAQVQYAFSDDYVYAIGGYRDPSLGTLAEVAVQSRDGRVRTTAELPKATGFGEAVVVDDWLFVVGGRGAVFNAPGTSTVWAGEIASDGSVTSWRELGGLPMARTNHEMAQVGDYLVLTGGAAMGPGDDAVLVSQVRF